MRTTIEIDDELLASAMKQTRAKTKREAVHIALRELVKPPPDCAGILKLYGTGVIDPDYDPKALYGNRVGPR